MITITSGAVAAAAASSNTETLSIYSVVFLIIMAGI